MTTNEILTPPEAMARLKCSRSTLYRLAARGVLRFIPGRPVKFLEADVDLYIRQELVRKAPPPKPVAKIDPATGKPHREARRWASYDADVQRLAQLVREGKMKIRPPK